jgi:hypothetical protein
MHSKGLILVLVLLLSSVAVAQEKGTSNTQPAANATSDISGMYTFLQEGEFVQVTVEDQGKVTGFVSRYGGLDSDRGAFLDQFFKEGKLDGKKLTFTTDTVHGGWYQFKGTVDRGEGKNPGDEAYYVLKGTLTQYTTDANKKVSAKSREVVFKQFPQNAGAEPAKKD